MGLIVAICKIWQYKVSLFIPPKLEMNVKSVFKNGSQAINFIPQQIEMNILYLVIMKNKENKSNSITIYVLGNERKTINFSVIIV